MTPDEPDLFVNVFEGDQDSERLLQDVSTRLRPNDAGALFEYAAVADESQQRFIDSAAQTIRLLAPAGSGKTQSLVNRVLTEVSRGRPVSTYLVLTYDNAAATSVRQRFAEGTAAYRVQGMPTVSTLNAFGSRLLSGQLARLHGRLTVGDGDSDPKTVVRRVLDDLRHQRPDVSALLPWLPARYYCDLIGLLKNAVLLADEVARSPEARQEMLRLCERRNLLAKWFEPLAHRADRVQAEQLVVSALIWVYRQYDKVLRNHQRIDFDDQKLLPYLALREDLNLVRSVMAAYRTVIVDEFQDVNRLDFEFVRCVAQERQLIVIGDDDQAIYEFRGCSPRYILGFPEYARREVETHVLNVNYRCPKNIVEMSTRLIRHNGLRIEKDPAAAREDEADVQFWHCLNGASEAQVIARTIRHVHARKAARGFSYSDVAVLYRMNSQSLPLQIALVLEEIPYHCRQEDNVILNDTMAKLVGLLGLHLKVLADPGYRSPGDTRLLCDCFFRYLRRGDEAAFHRLAEETGGYLKAAEQASLPLPFGHGCTRDEFRRAVRSLYAPSTPARLVEAAGGVFKNLGGLVGTLEEALTEQLPLGELTDIAGRFKGDTGQFHALLVRLLGQVQGGLYREEEGDAVNLLTYFRAKGRQWNTVILPGLNQKVIPDERSDVEAERRLFYVALTRATSELVLSYVRQTVRCPVEPSAFLAEMGMAGAAERRATFLPVGP